MDTIQQANVHYYNVLRWALQDQNIECYHGERFTTATRAARLIEYGVTLVNPFEIDKAMRMAEPLALQCQSSGVMIYRKLDKLFFQISLPENLWLNYYRGQHTTGLGIGVDVYGEQVDYTFEQPNGIMIGAPGAGKTYGSIATFLALCETFSVEEFKAVICDYHGDMSVLKNEEHLVNFEWGTIADSMDTTVRAIQYVYNLMLQRIEDQNKDDYRVLLFVDEVEAVADYDKKSLKNLVAIGNEGRKFKINLLVTAKHPKQENLPGLLPTITNRFVGQISMGKAALNRFVGRPMIGMYLTQKGDFVHSNTMDVDRFLVVRVEDKDLKNITRYDSTNIAVVDDRRLIEDFSVSKQGRPQKDYDYDLLAFLYNVGPERFSDSLVAKEWGINANRVRKHKVFISEFAKKHLIMRRIAKKYPDNWHPRLFNQFREEEK